MPAHPLVIKRREPIRALMGMPLCDKHFGKMTPDDFLRFQDVRESIAEDFRNSGALAHFERATIEKRGHGTQDWADFEMLAGRRGHA